MRPMDKVQLFPNRGQSNEGALGFYAIALYVMSRPLTRLAEAASSGGENATGLVSLYFQRCFHLMSEEYGQVEEDIRSIEESDG